MSGLEPFGGTFRSGPSGAILQVDRAFLELFEYDATASLAGTPLGDLLPDAEILAELGRAGGRPQVFRVPITTRRGTPRTALVLAQADNGGLSGAVIAHEEGDAHGQKLELLGRLAGGIAHDFNNILTAIGGYVEILLNAVPVDDASRENLKEIRRQADRAARLTRQLLAFGKRQTFQLKVAKVNSVVTEMFRMLERVLGDRMTLELDLDPALGFVRIDRGQFEQVVMNLVLNARDAMPEGGRIVLKTVNVTMNERLQRDGQAVEPGAHIRFAVTDTGVGMDRATMSRLFEPFFTNKKGTGTGLGLSMVYGIVKQSGGSIFVESAPGKGTTFEIWLPRTWEEPEDASASATRVGALPGSETILVAEDEAGVRAVVVMQLRRKGYKIIEAGNGEDALRAAANHQGTIHLLLSDVMMPGMTGPELAAEIVKVRPEIRIVFMTGYAEELAKLAGQRVLQKPFRLETLAQQLREALDAPGK